MTEFLKAKPLAKRLGVSVDLLKKWRYQQRLINGVHYIKDGHNLLLYNVAMVSNFIATRSDPETHQKHVESYLRSLDTEV